MLINCVVSDTIRNKAERNEQRLFCDFGTQLLSNLATQ